MVWKGWKSTITSLNMKHCKFPSSSWECHSCVGISFLYWGYGNKFQEESWHYSVQFSSVLLLSCVWLFVIPWTAAHQASLSITNSWSLLKFMSIESVMPSNHLILWHPLLLPTSIFPSIRVFSNKSALHIRWPKYWSFSISPSNDYSGLISFRINWFDLFAVQGTLKSLLQHYSSKASILLQLFTIYYHQHQ